MYPAAALIGMRSFDAWVRLPRRNYVVACVCLCVFVTSIARPNRLTNERRQTYTGWSFAHGCLKSISSEGPVCMCGLCRRRQERTAAGGHPLELCCLLGRCGCACSRVFGEGGMNSPSSLSDFVARSANRWWFSLHTLTPKGYCFNRDSAHTPRTTVRAF